MPSNSNVFVFGFYYEQGGLDYPQNHSRIKPFGYNLGSNTPVFKYSISDVERSLMQPRQLSSLSILGSSNRLRTITAEGNGNEDLNGQNLSSTEWNASFKILEYLHQNQVIAKQNPEVLYQHGTGVGYFSKGDEDLATSTSPYYVMQYVANSLVLTQSSKPNRLSYASFKVNMGASGIKDFMVYFDADDFVERPEGAGFEVYRYEDIENNDQISNFEFDDRIVKKLFEILQSGKFRQYAAITIDKWIPEVVNGQLSGQTIQTVETFFIFTTYPPDLPNSPFNQEMKLSYIRIYLRERYEDGYLRTTYRSLFTEDLVEIIPIYENVISTAGGTNAMAHPISLSLLRNTMNMFGKNYNPDPAAANYNSYKPTEIFYVGGGVDATPQTPPFPFPLVAVELGNSGVSRPIAGRFPSYRPVYGTPGAPSGSSSDNFHHYLILSLSVLRGLVTFSSIDVSLKDSIQMQLKPASVDSYNRPYITFNFSGANWRIFGQPDSVIVP